MQVLRTLPGGLPKYTIGNHVIAWCEHWLEIPDGERAGEPWIFTGEQARFIVWFYAVDEIGEWIYRRGILRKPKGWGKNPIAAALVLCELMGPCRFAGFDDNGDALARPQAAARIQVAAVNIDQTRQTTDLFDGFLPVRTRERYQMELQREIWRARVDGREAELRPITASSRSKEGSRPTFALMDETQHWLQSNGLHAMHDVIKRNLAKTRGRALAITNAHSPGEDSIAERDYNAWKMNQDGDILYDSVEPMLGTEWSIDSDADVMAAMRAVYGDAAWIDLKRLLAEFREPNPVAGHNERYYLNLLVAGGGKWMDPSVWDAMHLPGWSPTAGTAIGLGFDGSKVRDATVLVATEMETGVQWVVQAWERNWLMADWHVDIDAVNEVVERTFDEFEVARFYCDPHWWEDEVSEWSGRWKGIAAEWRTGGTTAVKVARALHGYEQAIRDGACKHGGAQDDLFRRHVLNTVSRPVGGRAGEEELITISKATKDSRNNIDAAMAGLLSWTARLDAIADGWDVPVPFKAWIPA